MTSRAQPLVTGEMLGLFVVFGADIILLMVLLAAGGATPVWAAALVTAGVLAVYGVWILVRWRRSKADEADPVETLKERYAAGELSDAEFEHRLDRILDTPEHTDRQPERPTTRTETDEPTTPGESETNRTHERSP